MAEHNELGKKGEELALEYLQKAGYKILDRNWRFGKYELDIVAFDSASNEVVAVEVKTRKDAFLENPEDAVNNKKQKRIVEATNQFVIEKNLDFEVRFDIVALVLKDGKETINHLPNAFLAI